MLTEETRLGINSCTADQLAELPMIGRKKAISLVRWREKHGRFKSLDDVRKVPGYSEKLTEGLKDFFTIDEYKQPSQS